MMRDTATLPIDAALPELRARLAERSAAVLVADPGAGKTTRVPLALLDEAWLGGKRIVMLEPRRLATRAAARRMAATLGEEVGERVGYRVRGEARVSARTRIEVVTDGLFLRRLQRDPALEGVGLVIFDEFHERGIETDLSLALALDAQGALRPELRLLVMSATLDAARVASLLGGAPVVRSEGRRFPIEIVWLGRAPVGERLERWVVRAIRRALDGEDQSILVFLPGFGEIRRVAAALADIALPASVRVYPLHGDLPLAEQDAAIRPPDPGERKIVLATAIAETSLTIEGIRTVIDAGLARVARFDPNTAMGRLMTEPASRAAGEQRAARAGRLMPGVCYRLWDEAEHRARAAFAAAEIHEVDLTALALELARWGVRDPATLSWLDPPPAAGHARARETLLRLGAIDREGAITAHGQRMAEFGLHPRLAHMLLRAHELGHGALACTLAALIGERDPLRSRPGATRPSDLRLRVEAVEGERGDAAVDRGAIAAARKLADDLRRQLGAPRERLDSEASGRVVALGWPDRVAQRREARGQFRLASGRGAVLASDDALAGAEFLAVADLDGGAADARIFLASPLTRAELESMFAERIVTTDVVGWDAREGAVLANRERRLDALVLARARIEDAAPELIATAMIEGLRQAGLGALPWTPAARALRARLAFMHRLEPEAGWPDVSDAGLLATAPSWLGGALGGVTRLAHLARIDLVEALANLVDWQQRRRLDALAPSHVAVPSGSRLAVDYDDDAEPALNVKLQEMFGAAEAPRIADGRVPLTLRLLSPAGRPIQVTRDLAGFWRGSYAEVRKEMRGRYPRHAWPDDPVAASPTARAKPRAR